MENFDWTQFTRRIAIYADMDKLYDAWTKADQVERWFLSECIFTDGENPIDRNKNVTSGNHYQWHWYLYDETEFGTITEANGSDMLQFSFAGNCTVTVQFKKEHDYVIVELTQTNIPTDDQSKQNIRLGCDSGWSFYLVNLKSVYEGGKDLRNKDTNLSPMVNN